MRFESLFLERFGMFADATLDFGDGKGLHVVYGPNEAGKSTALAAMSDLLFGIDDRTPYKFRFDYGRLRIGAKLVKSNGERLEFKRRKAKTGTLVSLSQPETTLPDAVLVPFLNGVDVEQFQFMFGLDQKRLRSGGKQMLDPHGNFANTLFAAGTGLDSVNAVLSELEEEIKRLGSLVDRRSKGEIWSAIDRFTAAISTKKADMIVPDNYHASERARDDATAGRAAVDEQLKVLRARRNFLERGRRVAPILRALGTLRQEIAQHDDIPDLPENFADLWKKADDDARSASEAAERHIKEIEKLTEKLAIAPAIDPIVGYEATIDVLGERLGKYLGDEDDVPKLARRIVELNDHIRAVMRDLGLDGDPDEIESTLPSKIAFAKIRELIKKGAVVRSESAAAQTNVEDAKLAVTNTATALKDLPADVDVSEPTELLGQVSKLGDVTSALALARSDADATDLALSESFGRLGLWFGTVDDLASLPAPDTTAVSRSEESRFAARQAYDALERRLQETEREALQVEADLAGLTAVGEVPSPKAIRDARDEREGRWRQIRSRLFQPIEVDSRPAAQAAGSDVVGTYETNVRHADELVDRREAEAQRVAQLTTLTASQKKIEKLIADLHSQRDAANANIQQLESEWRNLWEGTKVTVKSPLEMAHWLARKDEVLRLRSDAKKAATKLRDARVAVESSLTLLETAGQKLGLEQPSRELIDLDRQVRRALSKAHTASAERSVASANAKAASERLERTTNAFERAIASDAGWLEAWQAALLELHLSQKAGIAEAEAALAAWEVVTAPLTKRNEDQRRHNGLNEDRERFRSDVAAIIAELKESSPAGAPVENLIRGLRTRLDAAKRMSQERTSLQGRIDDLATLLDAAQEQRRAANFIIVGLRRTYGLAAGVDGYDLARRSLQRRGLRAQLEQRVGELIKSGDSLDEFTLQAEVDTAPPDQASAELDAIQAEEEVLIAKIQLLAKTETDAEHGLTKLGEKKGAAIADQEARNAALAAGGYIERWLRLAVARQLLERSVRRYQDENQNPMITRASELFARVASSAANPIERISIDYRDAAKPIPIGRRHDGSECRLEGLSEATSDQLFLALRVAAIERFCRDNEPMPFIADDLFMTSDEQRVLPLLQILAELGRTTQVIAFTHHLHVADIARTLPEAEVRIHAMPSTRQQDALSPLASLESLA